MRTTRRHTTRLLAALALLVMVAPTVLSQPADPDPRDVVAPVQTVLDAAARIITESISESRRDGTPDEAAQRAQDLIRFAQDLPDETDWTAGSQAEAAWRNAVSVGREVAPLAAATPDDIGRILRTRVGCESWFDNATKPLFETWANHTPQAYARLAAVAAALERANARASGALDGARLSRAIDEMTRLINEESIAFTTCMEALAERLSLVFAPAGNFEITLIPQRTWPTGNVIVLGTIFPVPAEAQAFITGATIGLSTDAIVSAAGGFVTSFNVSRDAQLGEHLIEATIGARTANATLIVDRAPTSIEVSVAEEVLAGGLILIEVRVNAPAGLIDELTGQNVTVIGAIKGQIPLFDGQGIGRFVVPAQDGRATGRVHFLGTELLEPSETEFAFEILPRDPTLGEAARGPPGPLPIRPEVAALLILIIAIGVGAFLLAEPVLAWLNRRKLARAPLPPPKPVAAAPIDDEPDERWGGLVLLFADFSAWLAKQGLVAPSHTPREILAFLKRYDQEPPPILQAFERIRYGRSRDTEALRALASQWIADMIARIRAHEARAT